MLDRAQDIPFSNCSSTIAQVAAKDSWLRLNLLPQSRAIEFKVHELREKADNGNNNNNTH